MCVVIDANVIPSVFNPDSANHSEFRPLYNWIRERKGKFVHGGSTFKDELGRLSSYLELFLELERTNRSHHADDEEVDRIEEIVKHQISDNPFNDHHIIAIVIVSKCRFICSKNSRHYRYFQLRTVYPTGISIPKIYSGLGSSTILYDRRLTRPCGPCKLN